MPEKIAVKDSTEKAAPAFTEGPWKLSANGHHVNAYLQGTSSSDREAGQHYYVPVARTAYDTWQGADWLISEAEYKANARLIAAAPSLYAALEDLRGFLNVTPLHLNEGDSITLSILTDAARAALEPIDGRPCHDCGNPRQLRGYEKDNQAGTDVLHIEICEGCRKERTE